MPINPDQIRPYALNRHSKGSRSPLRSPWGWIQHGSRQRVEGLKMSYNFSLLLISACTSSNRLCLFLCPYLGIIICKKFIKLPLRQNQGLPLSSPWLTRNLSYCTVKVTMTLCVIAPEIALTVTCVVAGAAGVVLTACCGDVDEEQPVIVAVATTNRRAKSDPRARIDLRLRPANASSPAGPMNARVRPGRNWNKWTK